MKPPKNRTPRKPTPRSSNRLPSKPSPNAPEGKSPRSRGYGASSSLALLGNNRATSITSGLGDLIANLELNPGSNRASSRIPLLDNGGASSRPSSQSKVEQKSYTGSNLERCNYITSNRFYVEIESELTASFTECSGMGVNFKKETYLEGGLNNQQRVILGHAEFSDVTLKRGMSNNLAFWNWVIRSLNNPKSNRRNVNILTFNQAGETMQCWTLVGAIPISWKAPGFQADSSTVAIEEITLAYEGLNFIENGSGGSATKDIERDFLGFFPSR